MKVLDFYISLGSIALFHIFDAEPREVKPNIIVVVADDLGYTDTGFHGGDQIPTPHIDWLAKNGIVFDNYYTPKICTPSRAALLTGRHPLQLGLQKSVVFPSTPYGLELNETILPQYLRMLGYTTHMIGKWHLGLLNRSYTPTFRGFDSHFGFWSDKTDYYSHENTNSLGTSNEIGLDFWDNLRVAREFNGSYGTALFGNKAVDLVMNHNQSVDFKGHRLLEFIDNSFLVYSPCCQHPNELFKTSGKQLVQEVQQIEPPFFLYLAHQAVHNGIEPQPLKAPKQYLDKFSFIKHEGRRRYAAMLSVLDDSIGNLTAALKKSGMYKNTLLVFTTDNGGPVDGFSNNYASNWPLRGCKDTHWEGGVRAVSFIHSPLLKNPGTTSHHLMHVSDWLPTLMSAIGEKLPSGIDYYGVDQWPSVQHNAPSARTEIIHNYMDSAGALRQGNYKLVICCVNSMNGWYPEQKYLPTNQRPYIACGERNSSLPGCTKEDKYCLFDLASDPCEYNNIASLRPEMARLMYVRLVGFARGAQPPRNRKSDFTSFPKYHNGHWTDWLDKNPIN